MDPMSVRFRIVGTDMPGMRCTREQGFKVDRANVHVGVQRSSSVVDLVPGDAQLAIFEFEVEVKGARFTGAFVHGQRGEQFLYLSWGEVSDREEFTMFRRAKLQLDSLDATKLDGTTIEGRLNMSDASGGPVCASVRPPALTWVIGNSPTSRLREHS